MKVRSLVAQKAFFYTLQSCSFLEACASRSSGYWWLESKCSSIESLQKDVSGSDQKSEAREVLIRRIGAINVEMSETTGPASQSYTSKGT